MATVMTHRAEALKPRSVFETIKVTAPSGHTGDYTINDNPENILSTVARSAEGIVVFTLAQPWAAIANVLVSIDTDDFTATVDSAVASTGVITVTFRLQSADASADTDPDDAVIRMTLHLRLQ